jgi:hypothetical protein
MFPEVSSNDVLALDARQMIEVDRAMINQRLLK